MGHITIKEIAEKAGVSISAVSLALNGKKGVSEETRKRVLKVTSEMDYTPNVNSRRLILQCSFNIVLALDPSTAALDNLFYTAILNSIVEKGAELGYNIVISTFSSALEGSPLEKIMSERNADGIIFMRDITSQMQANIRKYNIPYIVIDSHETNPHYPCVRCDYELGSYVSANYLVSQGHKTIGFIGMGSVPEFYTRCFNGYKRALGENGLNLHLGWVQAEAQNAETAQECMKRILECKACPTAVFCSSDLFAIGAMNYLQKIGYKIPDDFSFSSIDNILLSGYCYPGLTTINLDKSEMGVLAIQILNNLIREEETEEVVVIKSDNLIIRDSVCAL